MSYNKNEYQREYDKRTNYAAQKKFAAEHQTRVNLAFGDDDADVIFKLKSVANKTDYVRRLIRADIAKNPGIIPE